MPSLSLGDWLKVGLVIFLILVAWHIHALHSKVEKLELEIELWKSAYTILGNKVVEQNKSIQDLKDRTDKAKTKRKEADKKAAPIVRAAQEREKAVASVSASSGTCESELATISELLEARK